MLMKKALFVRMAHHDESRVKKTPVDALNLPSKARSEDDIFIILNWLKGKRNRFFENINESMAKELCAQAELINVPANGIVQKQGDYGKCAFVVVVGSVSLHYLHNEEKPHDENDSQLARLAEVIVEVIRA